MAEQAKSHTHKVLLLDLAQAWVLLAEQANGARAGKPPEASDSGNASS